MEFMGYLAMTAAEIAASPRLPPKIAYMGCHFSPYGTGLTGIPAGLPEGSVLMLTDRTPVDRHDPDLVAAGLAGAAERLRCSAVVLDLQRAPTEESCRIVKAVQAALPCPAVVTEAYASDFDGPVLVAPGLLWTPLSQQLTKWNGRQLWLEAVTEGAVVTVTEEGSRYASCPEEDFPCPHTDPSLHITYAAETQMDRVIFRLRRDRTQLLAFLQEAKTLGVTEFLGLYQQIPPLCE